MRSLLDCPAWKGLGPIETRGRTVKSKVNIHDLDLGLVDGNVAGSGLVLEDVEGVMMGDVVGKVLLLLILVQSG